jgi:ABC-type Mn2+/Zn2+ transport system permease subunit/Mn-dependent DtxR family transcriptional regulator
MIAWLYSVFIQPLTETYFQKALIGGSVVACVCGVVGCLVILRRMAFLGDALSHAMITGVVGGYLFMKLLFGIEANAPAMLLGSLLAAIITVALIGFVSRVSRLKEDTVIGIMYCGIFSAGIVLLSIFQNYIHIDIMHFIMGDILGISDGDLWMSVIVAATVLTVIILFFRFFQITSFDPIMAASLGIAVWLFEVLLTGCMAFVVVSAVSMVGVILSVGLLVTPAATAYLLTDRLDRMMFLAAMFGITSVIGGLYMSVWLDSAGGVAIMLFCTLQFIMILFVAPRYGLLADWRRKRRMIPQQMLEDILRALLKLGGQRITLKQLVNSTQIELHRIKRFLGIMASEDLITLSEKNIALTEKGQTQSKRIMRAHRLWESYLDHVGMPKAAIHDQASVLEHLHDEETVDFIDDMLGHPTTDPHGSTIPEDFVDASKGMITPISLLRSDRHAIVHDIKNPAITLQPGERFHVGPRINNEKTWVVYCENGREVHLDHDQADAVLAKVL